ncbi:MAG TPA: helix-turn-helix domain-containing protein [Acidimicrobiia bacterium]|nr:helix-turn-helix domain-containing protein [Acidimicrobiia bacterium]
MSGETRARILEVAAELFTEQGYEATSLRQIADRLGFTKAALYYHFQSKEQLFAALIEPAETILTGFIDRLEAAAGVEGWAEALDWVITSMLDHIEFFKLVERNRTVVAELESMAEHQGMHERVQAAIRGQAVDTAQQIRMIAALGAVTAFDDWAPDLMGEKPETVAAELSLVTREILGLPKRRRGR